MTPMKKRICHVVFFSSKDSDDIERIVKGLSILAGIPTVSHFEIGKNKDRFSNEVDVIVYAEFETENNNFKQTTRRRSNNLPARLLNCNRFPDPTFRSVS